MNSVCPGCDRSGALFSLKLHDPETGDALFTGVSVCRDCVHRLAFRDLLAAVKEVLS